MRIYDRKNLSFPREGFVPPPHRIKNVQKKSFIMNNKEKFTKNNANI